VLYLGKIRIPIHGFVRFDEAEREIINSVYFQRLRNIKQLSLTSYVYPGATHSRFEHSIGVMEVADRMFSSLCSKRECIERIDQSLRNIDVSIEDAKRLLRLSALMHDVGHLPFSHSAEVVLPDGKRHEDISCTVINSHCKELASLYSSEIVNAASQIVSNQPIVSELKLLRDIISGSIDADRTDYLIRDSHHCGVNYGIFDSKRLIESLTVVEGHTGGLELSINAEGVHALESLIMARYYMSTQVYYHKTRRIYDHYLRCYMAKWKPIFENSIMNVLSEDDISIWQAMRSDADENTELGDVARRILNRKNHSVLLDSSDSTDKIENRKIMKVHSHMKNVYKDLDFWVDIYSGKIHEFFSEGNDDGEELRVTKGLKEYLLTDYSQILKGLPKKFNKIRIYVSVKDEKVKLEKDFLDKLRNEAVDIERNAS